MKHDKLEKTERKIKSDWDYVHRKVFAFGKKERATPWAIATIAAFAWAFAMTWAYIDAFIIHDVHNIVPGGIESYTISSAMFNCSYPFVVAYFMTIWAICILRLLEMSSLAGTSIWWWTMTSLILMAITSFFLLGFVYPSTTHPRGHFVFTGIAIAIIGAMFALSYVSYRRRRQEIKVFSSLGNFTLYFLIALIVLYAIVVLALVVVGVVLGDGEEDDPRTQKPDSELNSQEIVDNRKTTRRLLALATIEWFLVSSILAWTFLIGSITDALWNHKKASREMKTTHKQMKGASPT